MVTRGAFTILAGVALACSFVAHAAFAQQGSYRPVEGQASATTPQGQFPPVENRGTAQRWSSSQVLPSPVLPARPQAQAGRYAPPGYGYGVAPYPQPAPAAPPPPDYNNHGWTSPSPMDPTGFMDDFFGGGSDPRLPGGYLPAPAPPFAAPVAPVYTPPIPAAPSQPPAYGGYGYPQQPQAGTGYPGNQQNWQQPATSSSYTPPAPVQQPRPAPEPKAPRPFSNPQESGTNFPLRSSAQAGRSDPRFRPPELKGTP